MSYYAPHALHERLQHTSLRARNERGNPQQVGINPIQIATKFRIRLRRTRNGAYSGCPLFILQDIKKGRGAIGKSPDPNAAPPSSATTHYYIISTCNALRFIAVWTKSGTVLCRHTETINASCGEANSLILALTLNDQHLPRTT